MATPNFHAVNKQQLDKIFSNIDKLDPIMRDKGIRKALKKAAKVIAVQAQENVVNVSAFDTGTLKKSIRVSSSPTNEAFGEVSAGIRVKVSGKKSAYYWWMIENGHEVVHDGKRIGYEPARPYLRPAITSKRESAKNVAVKVIKEELSKINFK